MGNYSVRKPTGLETFNESRATTVSVKANELGKPRKLWAATGMEAGYAVAQFVETLCYKPEGRVFDSR